MDDGVLTEVNLDRLFSPYDPPAANFVERLRYWADQQPTEVAFYFSTDGEDEVHLTYEQLDRQARAIAVQLNSLGLCSERVLLLYPPGLEFTAAFFGCLYAGVTPAPAYPPRRNRNTERIQAIADDAEAKAALTVQSMLERTQRVIDETPVLKDLTWLATDCVREDRADDWRFPSLDKDTLALLQYTSGSTGAPKGVMLTHANLMHNCGLITYSFDPCRTGVGVTWLPTHHDMGLVGGVLKPTFYGRPNVLMSPMGFLQKPVRWLRAITRFKGTISGGPNFAYALCVERITPEECEGLDLSTWDVAFNGAEPIRPETLKAFTEKFAPFGFRPETHFPCYGMAETTLIVTGALKQNEPVVRAFDSKALEQHRVVPRAPETEGARSLVGCGRVLPGEEVLIVDPETRVRLPDDHVGEIWVASLSTGKGYWRKPEKSEQTFRARLANGDDGGPYLRTGDLGFFQHGELFVTGRCKDLIIIRGRNHYPQDIELTVQQSHPSLRGGGCAVFSVDVGQQEQLVVVAEVERGCRDLDGDEVIACVRRSILEEHDIPAYSVLLLKTGQLPKTTSGKTQRHECRRAFLDDTFTPIASWKRGGEPTIESGVSGATLAGPPAAPGEPRSAEEIRAWLAERLSQRLQTRPAEIDVQQPFARYGLDSVAAVGISGELEQWLGRRLSPTLLYSYPTVAALAQYLADHRATAEADSTAASSGLAAEPIAVIGIGCRFPGAENLAAFWRLLKEGGGAIGDAPAERWDVERHYDADVEAAGKMYTRRGGFLSGVDQFDAEFFGIAPREAAAMDPQQRLLLETAWEALEHAGQAPHELAGTAAGVFVGVSNSDYSRLAGRPGHYNAIDPYTGTGSAASVAAGRLSYVFGLQGPCMAVDTACSSSLVAVHLAVNSLRNGECDTALAGGVNLILHPASMIALCQLRALSPDGCCKAFDASANGYVRGEGCGVVVLKRLSNAVADGDRILALIRNSAVNHDGRSNGLTAPNGLAQQALLRKALAGAGVRPGEVGYVEAHGTGTSLGDPIEVNALAEVFGEGRDADYPLMIGSVKTNVGHLEAAAGIAGLIKVVLTLGHGVIPPTLHLKQPNPHIAWDELPVRVPTQLCDWASREGRRIAGVSSFGFSGANAHAILEEAPRIRTAGKGVERPLHLLALSAKSDAALKDLASRYEQTLASSEHAKLADICFTANVGRSPLSHRLTVLAENNEQARAGLAAFRTGGRTTAATHRRQDRRDGPKIAFLFTGQGSQYLGMGRQLYQTQPTFRQALDKCDEILRADLQQPLLSVLYPDDGLQSPLNETAYAQPALFAIQYALHRVWTSWGIEPEFVMGHSVGEYAAACAAGVFSVEDGLKLTAARGRLMQAAPGDGEMAAVFGDEARVAAVLEPFDGDVSIAAVNGPNQVVISGRRQAVREAAAALRSAGMRSVRLQVSHAFHSALMNPVIEQFEEVCRTAVFAVPQISIVSNARGRVVSDEIATPQYWVRHLRRPVRFADGMQSLDQHGVEAYLELGPQPTLLAMGRACLSDRSRLFLASLRRSRPDWRQMLETLSALYLRAAPVNWRGFDRDYKREEADAPSYPFQRKRYWAASAELSPDASLASGREEAADRELQGGPDEWACEIQWRPRARLDQTAPRRQPDYLPATRVLADLVRPEAERLQVQHGLERYRELHRQLDSLAATYVVGALQELGWELRPAQAVTAEALCDQLRAAPQHRRLVGRLLEMLERNGVVRRCGERWEVCGAPRDSDPNEHWLSLLSRYPECEAELTLLDRCGRELASVLNGACDAVQVLFPGGSMTMLEKLYQDSPFARSLNALVEETVFRAVENLPPGRSVRILELGAGVGGATSRVLARLPADRTEYLFTDLSPLFTSRAQQKFRQYSFVQYQLLDIEADPGPQGFTAQQFDLVLAVNVLHATSDLRRTLQHVRQLMAPQGLLLLLEGTTAQQWLDLIFGLTEGWWRFADFDLRPSHPLLSRRQWLKLLAEAGFEEPAAVPAAEADGEPGDDPSQTMLLARAPRVEHAKTISWGEGACSSPRCWLVFSDRDGVGQELEERLTSCGDRCVVVLADQQFARPEKDLFLVRPNRGEDLRRVLDDVLQSDGPPCCGVVHLWSLDAPRAADTTATALAAAQNLGCGSVLQLVQELARTTWRVPPRLWLATRGAQPAGEDPDPEGVAQSPLWGFGRVIAVEHPDLWGGIVDLDPHAPVDESAAFLMDEIRRPEGEDQLAVRQGQRYVARLERRRPIAAKAPLLWRSDGSYLISGGMGDLGLEVARWMAERGARRIVLIGRTGLPPRSRWNETLQEGGAIAARIRSVRQLESLGADVLAASVDVADEEQVRRLLDSLERDGWPPIRGVAHIAGVTEDRMLSELDAASLETVMRPKLLGGWLLHCLLSDARLDFFVLFSSASALLGQVGQASYAAANAFLDTLAHHRRVCGLPGLSVNWGAWRELGLAKTPAGRRLAQRLDQAGVASVPPGKALESLEHLLEQNAVQAAVIPVDWRRWGRSPLGQSQSALLSDVVPRQTAVTGRDARRNGDSSLDRQSLLSTSPENRRTKLESYLRQQVSTTLGATPNDFDTHQPLNNLGMDSLMAVDLKNRIESDLEATIPISQFLQGASTFDLVSHLLAQLDPDGGTEWAPVCTDVEQAPAGQDNVTGNGADRLKGRTAHELLSQIDELSNEEVDSLLSDLLSAREGGE